MQVYYNDRFVGELIESKLPFNLDRYDDGTINAVPRGYGIVSVQQSRYYVEEYRYDPSACKVVGNTVYLWGFNVQR